MDSATDPNASPRELSAEVAWYALKVRSRAEPTAALAIRNRGYEAFAPVYLERRRCADRVKTVEAAAFPGYIFCRFDPKQRLLLLSCPRVEYVVGLAGNPIIIMESEIDGIRRMIAAGGRAVSYLNTGQRVRIEYGALAGIEGILERTERRNQVILSVELLQRSISVHVDADQVRAV